MWARLEELTGRSRRSVKKLDDSELDELLALYDQTSGHLSLARTQFDDIALANRLSVTLGTARGIIYRRRTAPAAAVTTFLARTLPATVWHCRRAIAVAAFLLLAPAVAVGVWMTTSGEARNAAIPPEYQKVVAASEFEDYYSSQDARGWAFHLWTNNARVGALSYAGGAFLGVGGAYLLVQNGAGIGTTAAVMHSADRAGTFWGLILPHGLLELTSIALAAGGGLQIAWATFAPGDRTRGQAIAEEGLRSIAIIIGTILLFLCAGLIEAFVTPSSLPTWMRITIGVVAEAAVITWLFGLGRNAAALGYTGLLGESPDPVTGGPTTSP